MPIGHWALPNVTQDVPQFIPSSVQVVPILLQKKSRNGDTLGPVELIGWTEQGNQGDQGDQGDQGERR